MSKVIYGFLFIHLIVFACSSKTEERSDVETPQANDYPDLVLKFQNGEEVSTKRLEGKNVFVLFQPDCDHCQQEAINIEQHLKEFKDYTLYFISSSSMDQITAFAQNFKLDKRDNVKFAWTTTEGVLNHYGPIQTPSVYIYSSGKLKQSFNGQTEIDTILRAL